MYPVLLDLGFIKIHSYGLFFALAFVVAIFFGLKRCSKYNIKKEEVYDIAFYIMFSSLIGAKVLSLILDYRYILENGITLDLLRSGFVFLGGLIGGVSGGFYYVIKTKKNMLVFMDFVAPIVPLSHAIGRIGCFLNGCCYGRVTSSSCGIVFPAIGDGQPHIPTQLIESLFLLIIVITILFIEKKEYLNKGILLIVYISSYSVFRFIIEFYRGDDIRGFFGVLSTSQWISIFFLVFSVFLFKVLKRK